MMKYAASILTLLALAGMGWAMVVATRPMQDRVMASGVSPAIDQQLKASDDEVRHLRGLERTLERINRLEAASRSPVEALALHSSRPKVSGKAGSGQLVKPDISLVYVSPDLQKVVINGRLLGTGDMLPGGGQLVAITQEQIVVERHGRRKALQLPRPHALGVDPDARKKP